MALVTWHAHVSGIAYGKKGESQRESSLAKLSLIWNRMLCSCNRSTTPSPNRNFFDEIHDCSRCLTERQLLS